MCEGNQNNKELRDEDSQQENPEAAWCLELLFAHKYWILKATLSRAW